jgi:zinc protease
MMTLAPRAENGSQSDASLWQLTCQGNVSAFEVLVRRHQSLVCAVAFSACGNVALSEDVAQETFWSAWRQRGSLERPDRLTAWLCGIARNLAKNARRKAARPAESALPLDTQSELSTGEPDPAQEAVSHEEESLLWQALERIPAVYREPLILFYRENQSAAEVAGALRLTEDAVKKRLSRGRGMLRQQVADLVEGGLRRSRPGRKFTVSVIAGLAAQSAGAKSAVAATAGAGALKAAAGAAAASGTLAGVIGSCAGLLGGWLGAWIPAQAAPTRRQRDVILHAGRRILLVSIVFLAVLCGLIYAFAGGPSYLIAWGGWMLAFWAYLAVECACVVRNINRIRLEQASDDEPNQTALRIGWTAMATRFGDRVYHSQANLLGLPLIDINLSAPMPPGSATTTGSSSVSKTRRIARGWIAIGDDARGILLGIGSTARGLVALGSRALGVLSFGGVAVGLVAFGGLGLGVVGIGGLGAGVYAFGGAAIGWRAVGGLAAGWDIACGGGAFAGHAACGGAAIARDFALGGEARAHHANDQAARDFLGNHPFVQFAFTAMGQRKVFDQVIGARAPGAPETAQTNPAGRFTLDNGLMVRVRPIQGANQVALLVLFNLGGDFDPEGQSGLAHLVEHLYVTAAAGAEPSRTAESFFQRYRANCNAQTGDRYTILATVFPKADLEKELTEAAARMADLRMTIADLEREKPRLDEELANMFGRFPALGAMNVAREQIRPAPRAGRKGGLPEQIERITLDDVRAHWNRYYKPRNAILVLAGGVDEATARQAVTTRFAKLERGDELPKPGEPGSPKAGALREQTVKSLQPQTGPVACLAFAAPQPGSELYAPFLVLVARFWALPAQPAEGADPMRPQVFFPLLEDPAALAVSATAKPGETAAQAVARLESFVAETIAPPLGDAERASAREAFAFHLGTAEIPDFAFAQNPYGAALTLGRREQLGIDTSKLTREFDALTEAKLRAVRELFSPARHAAAFISPGK